MKALKIVGVILGALIITALGIDATDTLKGARTTLLGQLVSTESDGCEEGMVAFSLSDTFSCVDIYEASPSDSCSLSEVNMPQDSTQNLESATCGATSVSGVRPWTNLSRTEAALACARSGKRLPTANEWYELALGTPDDFGICNIDSNDNNLTGANLSCVSAAGAFDTAGNVWEWVSDDVFNGTYNNRPLPPEGYINQIDDGGVATVTGDEMFEYGNDYFWSKTEGTFAMMRGGFYGSQSDAGVFAVHAATDPNFTGVAVGFRCVQ